MYNRDNKNILNRYHSLLKEVNRLKELIDYNQFYKQPISEDLVYDYNELLFIYRICNSRAEEEEEYNEWFKNNYLVEKRDKIINIICYF